MRVGYSLEHGVISNDNITIGCTIAISINVSGTQVLISITIHYNALNAYVYMIVFCNLWGHFHNPAEGWALFILYLMAFCYN